MKIIGALIWLRDALPGAARLDITLERGHYVLTLTFPGYGVALRYTLNDDPIPLALAHARWAWTGPWTGPSWHLVPAERTRQRVTPEHDVGALASTWPRA